ncbi:MAG: carboxypeptidase regulatory-like domain-containing protein [Bacteroidota bacterium]
MTVRYVLVLLLWCAASDASGQVLRGTVVGAGDEPLAGASVTLLGERTAGTTTDASGQFRLRLPRLPVTVEVRFLGYEPQRVVILPGEPLEVTIRLRPRVFELEGLDVAGENRAVTLMREVIRRKQQRRAALQPYTAEHYTRFTLRRRGEVIRVTETLSDVYVRPTQTARGDSRREIVLARHRRPAGRAFRYARVVPVPDFYLDDEVVLDGFRFIGPTHPNALDVYTFRVGDRIEEDGQVLWEVSVRSRSALASAFEGRLRVVDSLFVLAEAELRPSVTLEKEPPVQAWAATYRQTFTPSAEADSVWISDRFEVTGRVDVGVPGAFLPVVRTQQTTIVTSRRPGIFGGDSLFARRERIAEPPGVYAGRDVYAAGRSIAPPDDDEARVLLASTRPLRASLIPEGLLRYYVPLPVEEAPEVVVTDALAPPLPRFAESVEAWYNRVQGAYFGVRPRFGVGENVAVRPRLGIATSNVRLDAGLRMEARLPVRLGSERLVGFAEGGVATVPFERSSVYPQPFLAVPTYIGWADYHDYLRRTRVKAGLSWTTEKAHIEVAGQLATHDSLSNGTDYEGMFVGEGQRPNAEATPGTWRSVEASIGLGTEPRWAARPQGIYAELTSQLGRFDADGADATSMVRFTGEVGGRVATLFRRRPEPAALYASLSAGWVSGDAPLQLRPRTETRAGAVSGFGSFRTIASPPVSTPQFVQLAWEHDFGRSLFETVGLPVGVALTGGHLWTEDADSAHEVGLSLLRPFRFPMRIDTAYRLDQVGWFIGIGLAR